MASHPDTPDNEALNALRKFKNSLCSRGISAEDLFKEKDMADLELARQTEALIHHKDNPGKQIADYFDEIKLLQSQLKKHECTISRLKEENENLKAALLKPVRKSMPIAPVVSKNEEKSHETFRRTETNNKWTDEQVVYLIDNFLIFNGNKLDRDYSLGLSDTIMVSNMFEKFGVDRGVGKGSAGEGGFRAKINDIRKYFEAGKLLEKYSPEVIEAFRRKGFKG